jgi:hypothetical protein
MLRYGVRNKPFQGLRIGVCMRNRQCKFIIEYFDEDMNQVKVIEGIGTYADINDTVMNCRGRVAYVRTMEVREPSMMERFKMMISS